MKIAETEIAGVLLIEPDVFEDERGYFFESFNKQRYQDQGLQLDFVQDNVSFSQQHVLRGLHFQYPQSQGKLVSVLQGTVFDVAVDIRRGSPTFGCWYGLELSAENRYQLWIPEGCAHGFCVTSIHALFSYKCTDYYSPATEGTILWNDPDLAITWPISEVRVSEKDAAGSLLSAIPDEKLPSYTS